MPYKEKQKKLSWKTCCFRFRRRRRHYRRHRHCRRHFVLSLRSILPLVWKFHSIDSNYPHRLQLTNNISTCIPNRKLFHIFSVRSVTHSFILVYSFSMFFFSLSSLQQNQLQNIMLLGKAKYLAFSCCLAALFRTNVYRHYKYIQVFIQRVAATELWRKCGWICGCVPVHPKTYGLRFSSVAKFGWTEHYIKMNLRNCAQLDKRVESLHICSLAEAEAEFKTNLR